MELWGLPLPLSNTFFALPQVLWPKATVRRLMLPEDRLVKPVFDGNALYVKQGKVDRSACFPADWLRDCCSGNCTRDWKRVTGSFPRWHQPPFADKAPHWRSSRPSLAGQDRQRPGPGPVRRLPLGALKVAGHARSGLGGGTVPDMDGCRRAISRVKCNKRLPGVAFKNLRHVFLRRRASSTRRGPPFTSRAMSFRRVRLMAERSMPLLGRNWHSRTLGGGSLCCPAAMVYGDCGT